MTQPGESDTPPRTAVEERELALAILCTCGHSRRKHWAAADGSYGGGKCSVCGCAAFAADVR